MGGRELKLLEPLYVYDEAGNYTKEIDAIYERGTGCERNAVFMCHADWQFRRHDAALH